jgi:acyl-CoA thioester hydrolase
MLISEIKTIVRYAETDRMGIAHHSNYPIWFEIGRTDFIRQAGISYSEMERKGLLLPLIELKCTFKDSVTYEDHITILTRIKELTYSRLVLYYEIYKDAEKEKPITTGETTHVWTNSDLKPINIRKHFPDIYMILSNALEIQYNR